MGIQIFNSKDLGKVIRQIRKKQKLTQEDLSGLTGTGRRFIVELEQGKETAQIGKVLHVISALGVSIEISTKWG